MSILPQRETPLTLSYGVRRFLHGLTKNVLFLESFQIEFYHAW